MDHKYTAVANFKFNAIDDHAAEIVAGTVERMIEAFTQNDIMVGVAITEGKVKPPCESCLILAREMADISLSTDGDRISFITQISNFLEQRLHGKGVL